MADDQDVQAPEITPDDFMADEQELPKAESSPAKETKPGVVAEETKDNPEADDTADKSEEPEAKETDKPAEPDEETKPQQEDEAPKPKSENRYQKLANENRSLREQVEQLTSQAYQPQTVDELTNQVNPDTGEAYTVSEAAQAAVDQRMAMRDYNSQIVSSQSSIENESQQILQGYAWANSESDQYDEELAIQAAELVEDKLIRDDNIPEVNPQTGQPTGKGIVIGVKGSLSTIYKTLDRAASNSQAKGQLKGQQAAEKMLANADTASSAAPPKKKADPLGDLWAEPL